MRATSHMQYDSTVKDTVPDLERVRDGVWALPMPTPFDTVPYTLTYLIGDSAGGVHVIDPGWNSVDNWGALRFSIGRVGHTVGDVASIVLTHLHSDHTGLAERLKRASGAQIVMHEAEQSTIDALGAARLPHLDLEAWGVPLERRPELEDVIAVTDDVPSITADVRVVHGDLLDIPGRDVRVLHTPGHTMGSISLVQGDERLIYTGDTVLPASYPNLGRGGISHGSSHGSSHGNPISDYLHSLDRLAVYDDHEVCPGHGYRFTGLASRVERIARHHRSRTEQVERARVAGGPASVWDVTSRLSFTPEFAQLRGYYLLGALTQTAMHLDLLARR